MQEMQGILNFLLKVFFIFCGYLLSLYAGAIIFIFLINPNVDPQAILDNSNFYANIAIWVFQNWSYFHLNGAYVIIPGQPAVQLFLIKFFAPIITTFSLAIYLTIKKWATIKTAQLVRQIQKVHGDAKWASNADIERAGLRSKEGMLLGVDAGGYFVGGGFQHSLLFAPTGSGKGVGFVIPNLLFWTESCVVHDIKLENHGFTSGWRSSIGQKCFVWAPGDPDGNTHCYNPFDWISTKPGQMVDDVQKLASLILPKQEFWENEARSLFLGVVLYLIADPYKIKSFGEVVRTLRSDDVVYNLAVAMDTLGKQMHPVAYMNLAAFLQKPDKERGSVVSTLNSAIELWANPLIDTATASSDFNMQMLKKEKITVYVGLTPDNLKRLQPLMQIFYQQSTEFLSRKIPGPDEPHGVMFILDEFPTLGKMDSFMTGIAYFRGYKVRLFLIIQDTQQLKGIYEESGMNSFLSNATYRITFAANNMDTANLISQLCGNQTVKQESISKPQFFSQGSRSVSVSEVQRALLLPQEVIGLPRDEQIVLIESFPPIKSKKIFYYKDSFFTKRLLKPTPVPVQVPYSSIKTDEEETSTTETQS